MNNNEKDLKSKKKELRDYHLNLRNKLSKKEIEEKSLKVFNNIKRLKEYTNANNIMSFVPFRNEINTNIIINDFLNKNKKVFIPISNPKDNSLTISELKSLENDLEKGHFGVLEPKRDCIRTSSPDILELIIVPGLVFDKSGYRIGYGGGYYDRFLSNFKITPSTISLCYDFQLIDNVPKEKFDLPVDIIVTESQIIFTKQKKVIKSY